MSVQVNLTSLTGTSPYNVWVCDVCDTIESCIYIDTITGNTYSFILPYDFDNLTGYCVKIIDSYGCVRCECFGDSVTPTPSITPTITPTSSITPTPSITPTITPTSSVTPTISLTPTNTTTPSVTVTPEVSPSTTTSVTPSLTTTPTISVTPSVTTTPTISVTPSLTTTPTITVTPSVTITPDLSPSVTSSLTPTISVTPSVTTTPTISVTPSVTTTPTISVTPSVTTTPTISVTPSVTTTPTISVTPSVTTTPTISVTPSVTTTPTISVTPSVTTTPTISVTPSLTVTPSTSPPTVPSNMLSFYDCCDETYFSILTGGSMSILSEYPVEGQTGDFGFTNGPFTANKCYSVVTPNQNYTTYDYTGGTDFYTWNTIYNDCPTCINDGNGCAENNVSFSSCCDNNLYNVNSVNNPPDIGQSASPIAVIGGNGISIGECLIRVEYNASYPTGASAIGFTYGATYDNCDDCTTINSCPVTPSPTPSVSVTPTLTPTPTLSVSYDYRRLTTCCENMTATTYNNAAIPSSYGFNSGDVVSLDGVCYTLGSTEISSSYYPATIVEYADCDTCVQDTDNEPCAYTLLACAESTASLGDVIVQPTQVNIQVNEIYTTTITRELQTQITNISSGTFTISGCYSSTNYDENVEFITPYSIGEVSNCYDAVKCATLSVLLTNCVDGKTSIGQFTYDFLTGNTISSGDTISAAALSYNTLNSTTGTCYNVGGKSTTITTSQTSLGGVYWEQPEFNSSVETNCADSDCGCKTNFTIVDETGGGVSNVYYNGCDNTLYGPFTISPGSFISVTQCVNMNTVWIYATQNNYLEDISIGGTYSNC